MAGVKIEVADLPNGVRVNPDESLVVVDDTLGRTAWSFHIQPDGSLIDGQPFYHLELPDDVTQGPVRSGADGMTFDTTGHLYVATKLGIQVCDQAGRVVGIIRRPGAADRAWSCVMAAGRPSCGRSTPPGGLRCSASSRNPKPGVARGSSRASSSHPPNSSERWRCRSSFRKELNGR